MLSSFASLFRASADEVQAVANEMKTMVTVVQGSGAMAAYLPTELLLTPLYARLNGLGKSSLFDDVKQLAKDGGIDLKAVAASAEYKR